MARLRPARTMNRPNSQAWSRYSLKKPRKNYVRALPRTSLLVFNMGVMKDNYDMIVTLRPTDIVQLRSNALESARQTANKYLENEIPQEFHFKVLVYPHNVIREHKMATGAGADRISRGMSQAFGRPTFVAARIKAGQPIFMVNTYKQHKAFVLEAFRRSASKLSGTFKIRVS
ncbi:MAG: 50S ribosomal protein L16 [Candidatus Micrarchaeales archaeon]